MRVRIHVEFELSPLAKRALRLALPVLIILAGGAVYAGVPNTFKAGDSLSAQTMNDNFTALDQRLAKLETASSTETTDGGWSLGATYCGATGATAGDMSGLSAPGVGYAKGRAQCQATCSSPTAHMCLGDELVKTMALGHAATPPGWYAAGATNYYLTFDCSGWTSMASDYGPSWTGSAPGNNVCSATSPVLCCN